jgi:hypothetical protein
MKKMQQTTEVSMNIMGTPSLVSNSTSVVPSHQPSHSNDSMDEKWKIFAKVFKIYHNFKEELLNATQEGMQQSNLECTNCGKHGHTKENCWQDGGRLAGKKPSLNSI